MQNYNQLFLFQLDQASLGLRREFLIKGFDDKLVRAYYDYMIDIAVLFGADKNRAIRELKQVVEFEMQLANVSTIYYKRFILKRSYLPQKLFSQLFHKPFPR